MNGKGEKECGQVYQGIMAAPNISLKAKCLYGYLSALCGDDDECSPSIKLMIKELGISKNTLYKYMKELVKLGIVEKIQTYNGNLKGKVIYKINHQEEVFKLPETHWSRMESK